MHFSYPKSAQFGRVVPKNKFYEHASVNTAMKEKFVSQIDKIIWSYKLATSTVNLDATDAVPEIEVFDIYLKGKEIDEALLRVIDRSIPLPIIHRLHSKEKVQIKTAYKRPSDADSSKWVVESYFESEWFDEGSATQPLPVVLNLEALYEQIIRSLMPAEVLEQNGTASIKEQVNLIEQIEAKEREYNKLKAKRDKEKQFNRKAELNKELKQIKQEIEELKRADT